MMVLRGAGAGALLFRALFRHPTCSSAVVVSYNVLLPVEESVGLLLLPETSLHAPVLGGFSSCLGFRGFAAAAEVKKNNAAAAADVVPRPSMPRLSSNGILGRRFYKKAHVKPAEDGSSGWYVVLLDNRVLKTPAKKPLKVPNAALAHAVAAEWEWQVGVHACMHVPNPLKLTNPPSRSLSLCLEGLDGCWVVLLAGQ